MKAEQQVTIKQLQASEQANQELQDALDGLQGDRDVMHSRVSTLIGKIEEWEKGQNGSGAGAASTKGNEETMPIFSMGAAPQGES